MDNPAPLPMAPPMRPEPTADMQALRQAVAEGAASLDAGHSIPYADVRRWLLSWGREDELPPPECG